MNIPQNSLDKNVAPEKNLLGGMDISSEISNILANDEFIEILSMQIGNLDEMVVFNDKINETVSDIMMEQYSLRDKPEKFVDAFRTSSLSKFTGPDNVKDDIMDLIQKKKSVYQLLLLESIKRGNFNFPKTDLEDLVTMTNSGIFEWKDSLYRTFTKNAKQFSYINLGKDLRYGIPTEEELGTYEDSLKEANVNKDKLTNINNPHLREYVSEMMRLSSTGNTGYDEWVNAEKNEVNCWLGDDNLVFIAPMENYIHGNFIDPEFILLLREKTDLKPTDFEILSREFFKDDYGMAKVNVFFIEEILRGGNASFGQFLGKSFPNDMVLRHTYGNFIAIVKGQYPKTFDEYYKMVAKIFSLDPENLKNMKSEIVEGACEETIYHEYGHSLFGVKNTNLEEAKASLFYWLHLCDKYIENKEELNLAEIKRIMYSFTLDFTRYISRLENDRYRKYVYTSQIILHHMLEEGLLIHSSEENCLKLNIEDESDTIIRFKSLLRHLTFVLYSIQSIYETEDMERVDNTTKFYDEETLPIIQDLYKNF